MRFAIIFAFLAVAHAETALTGRILDPQNNTVPGAVVLLDAASSKTDAAGVYRFANVAPGRHKLTASAVGFNDVAEAFTIAEGATVELDLILAQVATRRDSIVITAAALEPTVDLRNSEVFDRTLFTRDDQALQQLNAGISAGQHEGGGKSLEIRRFGFNLDHGGVNGGLKVLLDDVPQNQGTQGHGQGYLGSLKALSPELIEDVTLVNGPFRAEYGDFSGLGVVHIRQRESLPDQFTIRLQGGQYDTGRGFFAFSPDAARTDAYFAYEGSYTDGPFVSPGRYRRDNFNTNYGRTLSKNRKAGLRLLIGRNDFYSSGQLPLDLVNSGQLDRFGYIDPTDGGKVHMGTVTGYFSQSMSDGSTLKLDAFGSRSLFDLYSNFTFFLNDPIDGDAFQQHDSRLQEGANAQYTHPHAIGPATAIFTSGGNFHDNQINVGLYPRDGRDPVGVTTRDHAHVTNGAGYAQETLSFLRGRLIVGGGLRYDEFRYAIRDAGTQSAGRWQAKGNVAYTPTHRAPFTLTANYGRGINSVDARGAVQRPDQPRLATTDFYEAGALSNFGRFSLSADAFLIDHSHEQVYIPDDGSFEFKGPSRSYGYEAKLSASITHHISINGGLTKIANAFYRGGDYRIYVDSAPHFTANAGLTVAAWHGWSGSVRMRAINHYRLDGEDASIIASGSTVWDGSVARQIRRGVEFNLAIDNFTDRTFYETQNYFESRVSPLAPAVARIHATPGYSLTVVAGVTFRLRGK